MLDGTIQFYLMYRCMEVGKWHVAVIHSVYKASIVTEYVWPTAKITKSLILT